MKNFKESTLNKADIKTALNNALKNGEEFDIPFKYSDEWEFTDELDNYLDKQGYEFVGSFRDKKYGSLYEYSDGFESIYLMMDTSLSNRAIVTGIISDKVYNESKKSAKKSFTEKMLQDICNAWVIGKVKGEFKGRNYCYEGNDYSLYNIGNIIEDALRDNYIVEFDGDDKTKTVIFNLINEDGKNVGTLEIFPDERYSAENYEDGFNWEDLNMKEIIKHFEDVLDYKIEYLKNDKRFDYSDRFWYKESKKSARKSMKETISKSTWGDWIVDKVERVEGFYNGSPNVRPQLINNLIESIGLNANGHILTFDDIAEEITKGIRAYKLKDLDSWHIHLGHNNDGLRVDLNAKVEHFSEVINYNGKYTVVSVYFYVDEQGTNKEYDFGFVADVLVEINPYIDFVLEESKKSAKKSLKEGINETLIGESKDGQFSLYLSDQRRANHGKDPHYEIILATNGYFTKYVRTDDKKAKRIVSDWITLYDIDLKGVKFSELFESKNFTKKSIKELFDNGDQLVIDVVDMFIFDFKYDKKIVEKYFYKIHKLNDFDTISIDEYIKIKEEIEKALGLDDTF